MTESDTGGTPENEKCNARVTSTFDGSVVTAIFTCTEPCTNTFKFEGVHPNGKQRTITMVIDAMTNTHMKCPKRLRFRRRATT